MKLEVAINKFHKHLNDTDFYVLNYIKNNKALCAKLSIGDLGSKCSVSKSFIIRMSQKLGYSGYSELKYQLKQEASTDAKMHEDILTLSLNDIQETIKLMRESKVFAQLPKLIDEAKNIYAYSRGFETQTMIEDFKRGMLQANKFVLSLPSSIEFRLNAAKMHEDSLLFVISKSGNLPSVVGTINELVARKVKVVSITLLQPNELAQSCHYNLYFHSTPIIGCEQMNYNSYAPLCVLFDNIVKNYHNYKIGQVNSKDN